MDDPRLGCERRGVLRVLHRDDLVLVIDKPAGVSTTPGRGREGEAALSQLVREIAPGALPVHRLDRDTSGVVLFALGAEAHRALNALVGRGDREYDAAAGDPGDGVGAIGHIDRLLDRTAGLTQRAGLSVDRQCGLVAEQMAGHSRQQFL